MISCSFIPKPSTFHQLQGLPENAANSFNDGMQSTSKNFFVAARGASIGADGRGSPPKSKIGAGIGQGLSYQRGMTLR